MILWALFLALVLTGEVFGPLFWLIGFVWFGTFEVLAVRRKKSGDTFSEIVVGVLFDLGRGSDGQIVRTVTGRVLYRKLLPARIPLVLGITVYICLVLVSLLGHVPGSGRHAVRLAHDRPGRRHLHMAGPALRARSGKGLIN